MLTYVYYIVDNKTRQLSSFSFLCRIIQFPISPTYETFYDTYYKYSLERYAK